MTVPGLTPSTTYYFAVRYKDEVPNWSAIDQLTLQTPAPDLIAPTTIDDLQICDISSSAVGLTWTAPADYAADNVGPFAAAGYDIRYSTSPINDDTSFANATPVSNPPAPAAPGNTETYGVSGLSPRTTYYFAIKAMDYAEPVNTSAMSNVLTVTTRVPIVPVVVHNPWIANDRVADTHNIDTMAATYVNGYTPDGVIPPSNDEQRAVNIYDNQKRRLYHWANEPPSIGGNDINDPTYNQNVFGWSLCGRHASQACTIVNAVDGLTPRKISFPGHWTYEVFFDGGWHQFDTMSTHYIYTRDNPPHIASCQEIKNDNSLELSAAAEGRACPGYLLCGDTPSLYVTYCQSWSSPGLGAATPRWTGDMDLRLGQVFDRTCESWTNEHPTPPQSLPDPPFHHEANKDYKDPVNYPYWEPYPVNLPYYGGTARVTYRRWSNGTDTLAPDFRSAGYQALLEPASHDIATYNDDAITPDLHAAIVGTQGEAIFKIGIPFYLTDASFSGDFVKNTAGDVCKVFYSANGTSWTQVYDAPVGTTQVTNQSLRTKIFGTWSTWYVKVQIKGTTAKADAGVSNFVVTTIFEHNKGAMAYLDKGVNNLTLTFDNAAELAASGNVLHVVYNWKEYDGSDWTIAKQYETYAAASPTHFTVVTGGDKVPRTESIVMEVVPLPFDPVAPGQVTDLTAGTTTSATVALTWTATGDDGDTGTAMAYDLRYSRSPISDDAAFDAATPVIGVPSPKAPGTPESFTAAYLPTDTTLYFAIKVVDKGGNRSDLSNTVTATTLPGAQITDLAAGTPTSAQVPLTWTAIDDGVTGQYASYDLRYSTDPITDQASFDGAAQVTGLNLPKMVGNSESFVVTYLDGSTTYYFALQAIDKAGNRSPISNVVVATTTAPARINDLTAGAAGANKIPLTWTAIGDGVIDTEASYNLRLQHQPHHR